MIILKLLLETESLVYLVVIIISSKARFPLPELTARVNGLDGPSTRLVETGLNVHKTKVNKLT